MAVYCVTGNLGSGKSLICVGRIYEALKAGRRVATNFNLHMEHLTFGKGPTMCLRLPDVPCLDDFKMIGKGSAECERARPGQFFDEKRNGIIVLDEISSMLDARTWQRADRQQLIDWLKHSRKEGWDVYFIAQHESTLDAQARKMLVEHLVICKRLDRVPIPFLGFWLKSFGFSGRFLKLHMATVRYGGSAVHSVVSERWITWGRPFLGMGIEGWKAYDTRQIFRRRRSAELEDDKGRPLIDSRTGKPFPDDNPQGLHQYLDLYRAPYLKPRWSRQDRLRQWLEGRGWDRLAQLVGALPWASERGPWFNFWLAETFGPPSYKPRPPTFAEWDSARHALGSGDTSHAEVTAACGDAAQPQLELEAA
jgi:hypothetical protein